MDDQQRLLGSQRDADIARLIRLEVLMDETRKRIEEVKTLVTDLTSSGTSGIKELNNKLDRIQEENDRRYVSREEFSPVKAIAFGLVGTVVLAVLGGIMAMVLR